MCMSLPVLIFFANEIFYLRINFFHHEVSKEDVQLSKHWSWFGHLPASKAQCLLSTGLLWRMPFFWNTASFRGTFYLYFIGSLFLDVSFAPHWHPEDILWQGWGKLKPAIRREVLFLLMKSANASVRKLWIPGRTVVSHQAGILCFLRQHILIPGQWSQEMPVDNNGECSGHFWSGPEEKQHPGAMGGKTSSFSLLVEDREAAARFSPKVCSNRSSRNTGRHLPTRTQPRVQLLQGWQGNPLSRSTNLPCKPLSAHEDFHLPSTLPSANQKSCC